MNKEIKTIINETSHINFEEELRRLINKCGIDNEIDTPDFILAQYLCDCLMAYRRVSDELLQWGNTTKYKLKTN